MPFGNSNKVIVSARGKHNNGRHNMMLHKSLTQNQIRTIRVVDGAHHQLIVKIVKYLQEKLFINKILYFLVHVPFK